MNTSFSSKHEAIELFGNSVNHLVSFCIKKKGNNLNKIDSCELFFEMRGPQISIKFLRSSWVIHRNTSKHSSHMEQWLHSSNYMKHNSSSSSGTQIAPLLQMTFTCM